MAVCYSLPPSLSSASFVLRDKNRRFLQFSCSDGQHTDHSPKFLETKAKDKKVSINTSISGRKLNYNYGRVTLTGGRVNRLKYKNSDCANTEAAEVEDRSLISTVKTPFEQLKLFYAFTRPYACTGIILNIASSSLIAIGNLSDISLPFLIDLLKVAAAFFCLSIYSSGINQLFDVEIDKINKPYLPLASGEMTIRTGILITSSCALMAFAIGISMRSTSLLWGIFLYFIIFSAYSVKLPFLRWKTSAIGAATSIMAGIGIVCPVATYLHMQTFVFGRQANLPKTLAFGTIIICIFTIVTALFKDIPDIEGDAKFGVHSLATRIGPKKVFWICIYLVQIAYTFAIIAGATSSYPWSKLMTMASHVVLSLILWKQAKSIDFESKIALQSFYMFTWKLRYVEFLLIPFMR